MEVEEYLSSANEVVEKKDGRGECMEVVRVM